MAVKYWSQIILKRKRLGLSQAALAALAGVSLPNLQRVEWGGANPSVETLGSILHAIGLEVVIRPQEVSWDKLSAFGVPIAPQKKVRVKKTVFNLFKEIHLAVENIKKSEPDFWRKQQSINAMLLAISEYYPSLFRKYGLGLKDRLDFKIDGQVLKLKRIALANISEYL